MSQAKMDQYKKEKANRRANAKKAKAKKRLVAILSAVAGVLVVGFLVFGIIATVKNGGLKSIVDKKEEAMENYKVEQDFVDFMNSAYEDTIATENATDTTDENN